MDSLTQNPMLQNIMNIALDIGLKVVGAIILWIVGRAVIGFAMRITYQAFIVRKVDETLAKYLISGITILLNVLLVVSILSIFGVETTSFAAMFAAAGVAIGMAWSGLLSNFAAGALMQVLRPFKVGEFIEAGGVMGTVEEIGLFVTTINSLDNVRHYVGNNAIFAGVIRNFSANPVRRVELTAQLGVGADPQKAIAILKEAVAKIPNVAKTPAPEIDILTFNLAGPVISVRPYTHNNHFWQVYFDTNMAISTELGKAGFPTPQYFYTVTGSPALPPPQR